MYADELDLAVVASVVELIFTQLEQTIQTSSGLNNGRLGDCLILVRRVATSKRMRALIAGSEWTGLLLRILGQEDLVALRPKLLALLLLGSVLPEADYTAEHREEVVRALLNQLAWSMWSSPLIQSELGPAGRQSKQMNKPGTLEAVCKNTRTWVLKLTYYSSIQLISY